MRIAGFYRISRHLKYIFLSLSPNNPPFHFHLGPVMQIPIAIVLSYLIMVVVVLLLIGIGIRLGKYSRRQRNNQNNLSLGPIIGAMMVLLAFILGFTLSMVSSRYAARKQLLLDETNAIGTAWLRTDFLEEPFRTESRKLLKKYVDIRVEVGQDIKKLPQGLADSELIHDLLWSQLKKASNQTKDSVLLGFYLQSLNEVIDIHSKRYTTTVQYHLPRSITLLLYFISILAMLAVGYEFGINGSGSFFGSLLLALMFSAVVLIILDLDRSAKSLLIKVNQKPIMELQKKLNSYLN